MALALQKIAFTPEMLSAVANFECGEKIYEREVADWIRNTGPGCVIDCMNRWNTKVWLYVREIPDNNFILIRDLGSP